MTASAAKSYQICFKSRGNEEKLCHRTFNIISVFIYFVLSLLLLHSYPVQLVISVT